MGEGSEVEKKEEDSEKILIQSYFEMIPIFIFYTVWVCLF